MVEKFQAVVIGGGPGGYVCAIRLAQLGLKTACVESRGSLGGTCLNVGCIPSKSLLNLSEEFHKVKNLSNKGIEVGEVKLNLNKMMKSKDKAVTVLTKGVEFLLKKNKVTYFKGHGSFKSKNEIIIKCGSGLISVKNIYDGSKCYGPETRASYNDNINRCLYMTYIAQKNLNINFKFVLPRSQKEIHTINSNNVTGMYYEKFDPEMKVVQENIAS